MVFVLLFGNYLIPRVWGLVILRHGHIQSERMVMQPFPRLRCHLSYSVDHPTVAFWRKDFSCHCVGKSQTSNPGGPLRPTFVLAMGYITGSGAALGPVDVV